MDRMSDWSSLMADRRIGDPRGQQAALDAYVNSLLIWGKNRYVALHYEGTVRGFRQALRESRKLAMAGFSLINWTSAYRLQMRLQEKQIEDLRQQILGGGGDSAA